MSAPASSRALTALLLALAAIVWFANIGYRNLTDPDEGRYAEISREMVATGDWVTPKLNGFKYFEKPALQYWATAVAFEIFGTNPPASRLYTTLISLLTAGLIYWLGAKLWSKRAGAIAAVILLSNLMWIAIGHINTLDMGLAAWLTAALAAFLMAQTQDAHRVRWMIASWFCIGLAVLSKGLVALMLPGFAMFLYMLTQRDWKLLGRLHLVTGLVVLAVVCAPWFLLVSKRNETFAYFFFIHEHFERYLTTVHNRSEPWWYFIPIFLLGSLPWTWALLRSAWAEWVRERDAQNFRAARFLVLYAIAVFVFFSGSGSKLQPYIVPMFPPLALLAGNYLAGRSAAEIARITLPTALVTLGLAVVAAAGALIPLNAKLALYADYGWWVAAAAICLAAGAGIAFIQRKSSALGALVALGFGGLIFGQLVLSGHDTLSEKRSGVAIAKAIEPRLTPAMRLYTVDQYPQSVPFYLKRTVTLVIYRGELDMGIGLDPPRWVPTLEAFAQEWQRPGEAIAMIEPRIFARVEALGLPFEIIHRDAQSVVIEKAVVVQKGASVKP